MYFGHHSYDEFLSKMRFLFINKYNFIFIFISWKSHCFLLFSTNDSHTFDDHETHYLNDVREFVNMTVHEHDKKILLCHTIWFEGKKAF